MGGGGHIKVYAESYSHILIPSTVSSINFDSTDFESTISIESLMRSIAFVNKYIIVPPVIYCSSANNLILLGHKNNPVLEKNRLVHNFGV